MSEIETLCMACEEPATPFEINFKPVMKKRRALKEGDILLDMKYCGVCHTDTHFARGELAALAGPVQYPCVPGHELAGICVAVGPKVTKIQVGDKVGVGCMVDSCLSCKACERGEEQMCLKQVGTYGALNLNGRAETAPVGGQTLGGYTQKMVIHERFAIRIPEDYPLEMAGPVMCAGITMYDPLKRQGAGKGTRVGIVGLGGLGLTGIKIAKILGCQVTAISRAAVGSAKAATALKEGADSVLCSKDAEAMTASIGSLDLILNTIPIVHNYEVYEPLVASGGKQVILGVTPDFVAALVGGMTGAIGSRVTIASGIGGIANTQEVVELFAKHKIYPTIEVHPVHDLNAIFEKLEQGNDASLRYVLDIATLNEATEAKCVAPPAKYDNPPAVLKGSAILTAFAYQVLLGKSHSVASNVGRIILGTSLVAGAVSIVVGSLKRWQE